MEDPVVCISDGNIRGNQKTNLNGKKFYSFLGIPFAKPPVGELRFKAPQPIEPWTGIKDATKDGPPCYNRNEFTFKLEGSEPDCLHVNVYTRTLPSEEQKLKPVMVWIYGGAFMNGSNISSLYGPEHLMTEDIVLVTINYRIGFLGFLHFNDTTLDIPGNAGLKDQQLALKWVQKNIKNFNGDSNNVTLFGESAGSASTHYHVVSPSSKGLFHKVIMQSGCLLNPWPYEKDCGFEFVQSIKKDVKDEKEALEVLRSLSVEELLGYQEKFIESKDVFWGIITPNIEYPNETAIITDTPTKLIADGNYNKVPIMLGYTDREGLLFVAYNNLRKAAGLPIKSDKPNLDTFIYPQLKLKKDDPKMKLIFKKFADFYFQGENANDKIMLLSDFFFIPGIIGTAVLHAKTSKYPVYLYRMSVDAGLNLFKKLSKINEPGVCHADDLGYLFNVALASDFLQRGPLEDKYVRRFVKLWTNFANTGNPTPNGNDLNITWKPVTEDEINFLDIGDQLKSDTNPEPERIKFWKEIFSLSDNTDYFL